METKRIMADFETVTWLEDETYVWAWGCCEIGNESNLKIGNNIDSFIEYCKQNKNSVVYFHNLKFDGEFILCWLLTHNFKQAKTKEEIADNGYDLSINKYKKIEYIPVEYPPTSEILAEIKELQEEISKGIEELEGML